MRSVFAALIILTLSIGCTKNNRETSNKLPYNSAIKYTYKKLDNKENAAMVNDVPVSWSQLRSQDAALAELEQKYNDQALAFVYAYGLMTLEKATTSEGKLTIDFYGEEPTSKIEDIVKASGLDVNKNITVNFVEGKSEELAKVGNKVLTVSEFIKSNLNHSKLYKKVFTQRMQRLNGIVIRRFLLEASKSEKINMEEYVKQKILGEVSGATEADVRAFAKDRGISEGDLDEKMIERLKEIVQQKDRDSKIESFVAKNLIKNPIHVAFMAPIINIQAPELNESIPQWGKGDSPSVLFVGHWSCDDCESPLKSFLKAKEKWGKKINGAFIYSFPERDREARMGAEAALCVFNQDKGFFWTFMDKIVNQPESDDLEGSINEAAKSTGADYEKFRQCFLKREYQQAVDTHLAYAKEMGVFKAPLMVVDGQVLELSLIHI